MFDNGQEDTWDLFKSYTHGPKFLTYFYGPMG